VQARAAEIIEQTVLEGSRQNDGIKIGYGRGLADTKIQGAR
jgi:hypothetical protein